MLTLVRTLLLILLILLSVQVDGLLPVVPTALDLDSALESLEIESDAELDGAPVSGLLAHIIF